MTGALKPAWSKAFDEGVLAPVQPLLAHVITKQWTWGGATGAGVDVIDSGLEAGHPLVGEVATAVALPYDGEADDLVRRVEGPHEDLFGHGTACAGIIRKGATNWRLHSIRVSSRSITCVGSQTDHRHHVKHRRV